MHAELSGDGAEAVEGSKFAASDSNSSRVSDGLMPMSCHLMWGASWATMSVNVAQHMQKFCSHGSSSQHPGQSAPASH